MLHLWRIPASRCSKYVLDDGCLGAILRKNHNITKTHQESQYRLNLARSFDGELFVYPEITVLAVFTVMGSPANYDLHTDSTMGTRVHDYRRSCLLVSQSLSRTHPCGLDRVPYRAQADHSDRHGTVGKKKQTNKKGRGGKTGKQGRSGERDPSPSSMYYVYMQYIVSCNYSAQD